MTVGTRHCRVLIRRLTPQRVDDFGEGIVFSAWVRFHKPGRETRNIPKSDRALSPSPSPPLPKEGCCHKSLRTYPRAEFFPRVQIDSLTA